MAETAIIRMIFSILSFFFFSFFLLTMKSRTYSKLQHIAIPIRHVTELSLTQWIVSALLNCVFLLISCVKSCILFQQKWLGPHFTTDLSTLANTGPKELPLMFFPSLQSVLLENKTRRAKDKNERVLYTESEDGLCPPKH